jgi:hypothetical protein
MEQPTVRRRFAACKRLRNGFKDQVAKETSNGVEEYEKTSISSHHGDGIGL